MEQAAYQRFLRKFVQEYADSVALLSAANKTEGARFAHKLKGVAGTLALPEVAALARELEQVLQTDENPAASLMSLQLALQTALASIERYAPG
jgi:HPt (histidine-containing phosphotransfer) domain-containing protein